MVGLDREAVHFAALSAERLKEVAVAIERGGLDFSLASGEEQVAQVGDGELAGFRDVVGLVGHPPVELGDGLLFVFLAIDQANLLAVDLDVPGVDGLSEPRLRLSHEQTPVNG